MDDKSSGRTLPLLISLTFVIVQILLGNLFIGTRFSESVVIDR